MQVDKIQLVVDSSSGGAKVKVACPPHLPRAIEIAHDYIFLGLRLTGLKDTKTDVEQLKLCLHHLEVTLGEKQDLLSFQLPKDRSTKPKRFGLKEEGDARTLQILFGRLTLFWSKDIQLRVQFQPNASFLTALSPILMDPVRYYGKDMHCSSSGVAITIMCSIANAHCDSPSMPTASIAVTIVLSSLHFFPQLLGALEKGFQANTGREMVVAEK